MTRRLITTAAVLAVAVLAAGCGGDDDEGPTGRRRAVSRAASSPRACPPSRSARAGATVSARRHHGRRHRHGDGDARHGGVVVRRPDERRDGRGRAGCQLRRRWRRSWPRCATRASPTDDLQTEQVSVYPRTSDDGISIVGYDASNTVRATIRDLDQAGAIVDAAVAAGANQVYGPSLTVSDAEAQYAAADRRGVRRRPCPRRRRSPRRRASRSARRSRSSRAAAAAWRSRTTTARAPRAAADVAIEPGTQDVGATLTVTFAIG